MRRIIVSVIHIFIRIFELNIDSPLYFTGKRFDLHLFPKIIFLNHPNIVELPFEKYIEPWILVANTKLDQKIVSKLKKRGLIGVIFLKRKDLTVLDIPTYFLKKEYYKIVNQALLIVKKNDSSISKYSYLEHLFQNAIYMDFIERPKILFIVHLFLDSLVLIIIIFLYVAKRAVDRKTLPKGFIWRKDSKTINRTDTCSICLDVLQDNNVCTELNCNHIYHIRCIEKWSDISVNCPLCRMPFV